MTPPPPSHACTHAHTFAGGTKGYCPVITVGGSYPGFLSAMMRTRYPGVVDMAYAASAPLRFYAQQIDQYEYYKVVTASAERSVKGCAHAVRYSSLSSSQPPLATGRVKAVLKQSGASFLNSRIRLHCQGCYWNVRMLGVEARPYVRSNSMPFGCSLLLPLPTQTQSEH
jgi:hypothetical protein